jgi:hypothetical protein
MLPSPRDWDTSVERPMQTGRTLGGGFVSSWAKSVLGATFSYEQRISESTYLALAALDAAATSVTLVADGSIYAAAMSVTRATRVYQNGQPYRDVVVAFAISAVVA